jgi:PAS domain S-box-containing protein
MAILIAMLALTGWALDIATLKSVRPGLAQMKANTAVCVFLAGVSLWLAAGSAPDANRRGLSTTISRIAAAVVLVIGALTVVEYVTGWNLGIDELLFRDDPGAPLTFHPGRMAPNTALGFFLLGGALVALDWEPRPGVHPALWLALGASAIAFAGLVGYLYSVTVLFQVASFTGMSVHTALAMFVLSVTVLVARPYSPILRIAQSSGPGSRLVRVLFPAVVLVPLALGWLRLEAERAGYFGHETGAAAMVTAVILLQTIVLYFAAAEAERMEGERSRAQGLFQVAVDASPNGMLMVDPAGRIVLANRQTESIFGYSAEDLTGRPVELLLPPDKREMHKDLRRDFFDDAQARRMGAGRDLRALRKDGEEFPVEVGLNPIRREDGMYVLASVIDITERKQIELELLRSNEELERFAYVASHDLQEPLRMVSSYVQLLATRYEGQLDADADDFIAFAREGAVRAQQLINGLLDLSRIGTRGAELVPTDARAVLDRALKSLELAIHDAGASVTAGALPTVSADPGQLESVFLNLVSNAIKFRGTIAPEVHVSAEPGDREWIFAVRDNGVGIDAEYFDRIFVIFQRLHPRDAYPGTGMGLALARKIVERHGGRIWVESEPGEGSTFFFTLPHVQDGS